MLLDGNNLTLEDLERIVYDFEHVELSEECKQRVQKCRDYVEKIVSENKVVYGLTTGFGKFSTIRISPDKLDILQENLILSHATGVGNILSVPETRAILLLRINVLAKGHSGIRLETLQTLIDMLNMRIHPCIPEKGSVGASGDLAPLSHLALVLLGKGEAEYHGEIIAGNIALERAGLKPVTLKAKEGLALNNGTQVMTGIAALLLLQAEKLCKQADICAAATVDSLLATPSAFDSLLHKLRPYQGQLASAQNLTNLLDNSSLRNSHKDCGNVQDAYSLRCTPQVHGAVRESLRFVRSILETEINSATDNPLIFPDEDKVISGGNFHGEPVAFAADILGFTVSELANISERRTEQLLNPALNRGLSPFLAGEPGVDSGFMIAQLTSASLVSENKVLSHPASVDSIPTSANQEDHVSMGTIGAVKARTIIENATFVLAIELMCAAQALDSRKEKSSQAIEAVKNKIRQQVPTLEKDRFINPDMHFIKDLLTKNEILRIVQGHIEML
jgi:histidine ammonia-lyase